jgi:hypothetical protein
MANLIDIKAGDVPRFPNGRMVLICRPCRNIRTSPQARPCEKCGGEMQATVLYNAIEEEVPRKR